MLGYERMLCAYVSGVTLCNVRYVRTYVCNVMQCMYDCMLCVVCVLCMHVMLCMYDVLCTSVV